MKAITESSEKHSEKYIAHLGMIQGVINRMASNSFALKALAITISAAMIAITGTHQGAPTLISYVGVFPVVVFWLLLLQNCMKHWTKWLRKLSTLHRMLILSSEQNTLGFI